MHNCLYSCDFPRQMHLLFVSSYFCEGLVLIAWLVLYCYCVQLYMKINMDKNRCLTLLFWEQLQFCFLLECSLVWGGNFILMVLCSPGFFVSILISWCYLIVGFISPFCLSPTCNWITIRNLTGWTCHLKKDFLVHF